MTNKEMAKEIGAQELTKVDVFNILNNTNGQNGSGYSTYTILEDDEYNLYEIWFENNRGEHDVHPGSNFISESDEVDLNYLTEEELQGYADDVVDHITFTSLGDYYKNYLQTL